MKKIVWIALLFPLLMACNHEAAPEEQPSSRTPEGELYHDMIQLGEKLDDPYTVANMQKALARVYPTKAERAPLTATDYYVRFLPQDDDQLQQLKEEGLYLMDHPMDYSILREGDYYQDPEVGENDITWQYAVVPVDFAFPDGIRYEVLDECFLAEHQAASKADDGVDWNLVEQEAYRLTGNGELLESLTKGSSSATPEGRITVEDPNYCDGKPIGVSGIMVACNIFVRISTAYTDRDGYYKMKSSFSGTPRYRVVCKNEKGFNIGFNFILVPASVFTLGKAGPEGVDFHVTQEECPIFFRRCVVNNAAYDYYSRCNRDDLDVTPPPVDLRFWILDGLKVSSATMLHHGAFLEDSILKDYLGIYMSLVEMFLPDITIGPKEQDYAGIYASVIHELAHASHYAKVRNDYWAPYIRYVLQCFVLEGWSLYGSGTKDGAGYCEVSEMWAYFMEAALRKERYGGTITSYGNEFVWFYPDIFTYLYERGLSYGQLFKALTEEVTGIDDLKESLLELYPHMDDAIEQTFAHFDK
ncbi:MAG: hypothetical protein J6P56_02265 [Bacteroidales bacterium]|nr:hypothetical protein [Bacteroidales bacterium]